MNNKGFILSTYVYILLIFFLLLLGTTLIVLNNTKMLANKMKENVEEIGGNKAKDFSIILLGDKQINMYVGDTFDDPGYIAKTTDGKELTATITDTINNSVAGNYTVTYTIKNGGKSKSAIRIVKVNVRKKEFEYTGSVQKFSIFKDGYYRVELWGAQGGGTSGGNGAYTSGEIFLNKGDELFIYVGGNGKLSSLSGTGTGVITPGGYNGGGASANQSACCNTRYWGSGGGATDVRYFGSDAPTSGDLASDSETGLKARIMVAGGGGGGYGTLTSCIGGGHAGGLNAYNATTANSYGPGYGATQIAGGAAGVATAENLVGESGTFGIGGSRGNMAGGGGGGYYGGGGSAHIDASGGGSSYISGHEGCVAINNTTPISIKCGINTTTYTSVAKTCGEHYSTKTFDNTVMIDGAGYRWTNEKGASPATGENAMPDPEGGYYNSGAGHVSDGYAIITYMGSSIE